MELGANAHERPDLGSVKAGGIDMSGNVRDILSQHGRLSGPIEELSDTSDLYAAGLTSLATVGLMLALEEGFEIEFPDSMLSRKTFGSIASLVAAVEALRAS